MKEKLNITVESGLKQQAKAKGVNLSEAVEQVLKDKTKDTTATTLILQVEKYGITLVPSNFVVGRIKNASEGTIEGSGSENSRFLDQSTISYHPNLHQALIQLSKRILEDKLKVACKDKPFELKELAKFIQAHHEWFVNLVKGM